MDFEQKASLKPLEYGKTVRSVVWDRNDPNTARQIKGVGGTLSSTFVVPR